MPCLQLQGVGSCPSHPYVPEGEDEKVAQSSNQHSLPCDGDLPESADEYQMVNDVYSQKWFEYVSKRKVNVASGDSALFNSGENFSSKVVGGPYCS